MIKSLRCTYTLKVVKARAIVFPSRYCCRLFWQILTRIHIPIKEVQLKLILVRGKIQEFFLDTLSIFTRRNEHGWKLIFTENYKRGILDFFSVYFWSTWHTSHHFSMLSSWYFSCGLQWKIPLEFKLLVVWNLKW